MIEARGLTKRYGNKVAVDDLTFTVKPGVVSGFLGPNDSGWVPGGRPPWPEPQRTRASVKKVRLAHNRPYGALMGSAYPLLNAKVRTPRLTLTGASDDLLERMIPAIRDGVVSAAEMPFDDPMSLYQDSPQREWQWLRAIWAGRARVDPHWWRFYFVVMVDDAPVGMQDLVGVDFATFGTVSTFSWLLPRFRHLGLGTEMRTAVLHLAFAGLGAREAESEAFADNEASNRISLALGYQPNGTAWATRRGNPAPVCRWRLTRQRWERVRRHDIKLGGVGACLPVLGLDYQKDRRG